jgi:hypothetical protein
MIIFQVLLLVSMALELSSGAWSVDSHSTLSRVPDEQPDDAYQIREIEGWTIHINRQLLKQHPAATETAIRLTREQLKTIVQVVPAEAVEQLRQVPLWFNPKYDGVHPRAEYHPGRSWLIDNHRNPEMVRGVEFSNVSIFEKEVQRMPVFVLHELAHAYHHRVLGHGHAGIRAAYKRAKELGSYDHVQRWRGPDQPLTNEMAYAMTNEKEYFAEITEAFFGRNDFYPFTRDELRAHDPEGERLLLSIWGEPRKPDAD